MSRPSNDDALPFRSFEEPLLVAETPRNMIEHAR